MSAHHTAPAPTDDIQKAQNKPQPLLDQTPSRQDGQTFYTMEPPAVILHDPNVTFEEYLYWAEVTRAEEKLANERYLHSRGPLTLKSVVKDRFRKGDEHVRFQGGSEGSGNEDVGAGVGEKQNGIGSDKALQSAESRDGGVVTLEEWKTASRAVRTAGWGAVFYLITTDILGPFSTPWAFAQMGYGPGIALYTVFGVMSLYSGWILYKAFLGLDSDRYPLKGYGDLYFRVFGAKARHAINLAQGLQLMLFVAVLILANGQSISQISKGPNGNAGICFVACLVIFMAAGFILGQIRTLQRFSWIANLAVWVNLLIIFICMGVVAHSPPNFAATQASFGDTFGPGPVITYAGTPPPGMASGGSGFLGSMNGLNQAVYSYGGCLIFAAFMAEMRHPMDFWKALLCGEVFIYVCYLVFGLYVYSFQGQYAFNPAMQSLSPYWWQTATNILGLVTGLIAAGLYGNIGMKVLYVELLQEIFGAPPLTESAGKMLWAAVIPVYWALAFIIGAAVPQFSLVSGFIGALFILSFTYTLPALLGLGYWIRKDAMVPEQETFDPTTGRYAYVDSGFQRYRRGFMKRPLFNVWNIVYMLGGLVTTALGMYSSIEGLIAAFNGKSQATSFGCGSPV
ncbi:transmembrane amino acid transporter [Colletotrichum abscissum]|uniref:Transmembrane amino acid transporter n=1 Tax=Colletotrichum abscissum TaxID=1671311 RepID=A0A9P9X7Z9_9PEZI|nr:transmembrane amino acid transporter [Colletotrichum abscissum]KAI3541723.1 transmembrane amino acid transporter [Colletotrichum abscissum]KAK1516233.1 transmembrane amino acid transporter [Colletotrichum abscissum]